MNWKEQAKAQFAERRKPETLVAIPVPAWNMTVYYWPDMTLSERREIFMLAKQKGEETILDLEAMAVTMIVRARDKEGKRLFHKAEKLDLMNDYDPEVITEIVAAMNAQPLTVEDAEKN